MNADIENLVGEQVRAIRDKLDKDLVEFRHRVASIERHLANLRGDVVLVHRRVDHQSERLERIDRRAADAKMDEFGAQATADRGSSDARMDEVSQRVSSMERRLADMQRLLANQQGDVALVHQRLDDMGERLERIERRLDLGAAPI